VNEFFDEGGWTMYPTAFFGALAVLTSMLVAMRPERRFVPLLLTLCGLTLSAGVFGSITGVAGLLRVSARMSSDERATVMFAGTAESLHNVLLAVMVLMVAALVASSGALRFALSQPRGQPADA
jgi:hypothetical protein